MIEKTKSGYDLVFSNGRREHFRTREAAEKRERQIQFFKHRTDIARKNAKSRGKRP